MSQNIGYTIRRVHKTLALVIGLQFLFWTASGLFFTIFPIEQIRGEHLVHETPVGAVLATEGGYADPALVAVDASEVKLRAGLGGSVYEAKTSEGYRLHDARTGVQKRPLSEEGAAALAAAYWKGRGEVSEIRWVERPPRETGSKRPLWRVQFDGKDRATLWIDPVRAQLKSVRTTKWRIFDVLWRFHIMDVTGDDRFDSWWLRLAAFLGLTMVLFGFALLIDRARKRVLLK